MIFFTTYGGQRVRRILKKHAAGDFSPKNSPFKAPEWQLFKKVTFFDQNMTFFTTYGCQRVRRIKKKSATGAIFSPKTHILKPQNDFFLFVQASGPI